MSRALTPVEAALAPILADLAPVKPTLLASLDAIGAFLAETMRAAGPIPPHAVALADGYAVDSLATTGASPYSPAILSEAPRLVAVGDALPEGCDSVAPVEAVLETGGFFQIVESVEPGRDALAAGADLAKGAIVAEAGARLSPLLALALMEAGSERIPVRRPRAAILGAEDGLAATIAAMAAACGCDTNAPSDPDLILAIGDTPPGTNVLRGLALRPGEAAGLGRIGETPLILLPARFDGAVAGFVALALPLIGRLVDRPAASQRLSLTGKISSAVGLSDVVLLADAGEQATPLGVGEITLAALARASAALVVGPESEGHPAGAVVEAIRLPAPFG